MDIAIYINNYNKEKILMVNDPWQRLVNAILNQTNIDWRKNIKIYEKKKKEREQAIRELFQIIQFIYSDWYRYLTNGESPQDDIAQRMIEKISNPELKKEIINFTKKTRENYLKEKRSG